jgi:hypothetical protein
MHQGFIVRDPTSIAVATKTAEANGLNCLTGIAKTYATTAIPVMVEIRLQVRDRSSLSVTMVFIGQTNLQTQNRITNSITLNSLICCHDHIH